MTSINTTSVVIDRLADALAREGVSLKRHQLIKVAARAFGYRNEHYMQAAHAAGEMSAPAPGMKGYDDHGLAVLHDPLADLSFAMDVSAASERSARWTISPYGNILDVSALKRPRPHDAPAGSEPPVDLADIAGILAEHPIVPIEDLHLSRVEALRSNGAWIIRLSGSHGGDAEALDAWSASIAPVLKEASAHVERRAGTVSIVFEGSAGVAEATSATNWIAATADLLTPAEGRERIHARFTPEAWVNDYAMEVDAQGDRRIDVTYEMLLLGFETASGIDSGDADHLQEAVRAPEWIRRWNGPFTITVHEGVIRSMLFPST